MRESTLQNLYLKVMDVHSKLTRSYNMSQIKGKNTKPELLVRKFLHSNGFRYKLHEKKLPGKPDLVLPKYKTIIEVQGCFWHGHEGCDYFKLPGTNTDFWKKKIDDTIIRDAKNHALLEQDGWRVFVVWECQLKGDSILTTLNERLLANIREGSCP